MSTVPEGFARVPFALDYAVSRDGRVCSLDRRIVKSNGVTQPRRGIMLRASPSSEGYRTVSIHHPRKSGDKYHHKTTPVYILVAATYLGWVRGCGLDVDHIDRDKTNDCVENLRLVPHHVNMLNQATKRTNKSGYPGVYWREDHGNWYATVGFKGKHHHLGAFDTREAAIEARKAAVERLAREYGGINHHDQTLHQPRAM